MIGFDEDPQGCFETVCDVLADLNWLPRLIALSRKFERLSQGMPTLL